VSCGAAKFREFELEFVRSFGLESERCKIARFVVHARVYGWLMKIRGIDSSSF
jgi:hypothetical protein